MGLITTAANAEAGSSVRGKLNALIGQANLAARYLYAASASDQANSMAYAGTGVFSVDDVIETVWYSTNKDNGSGGRFRVVSVLGSPYAGTVGDFANGGASGAIIEGLNYRFALIPSPGGRMDIRQLGIRCVETVTGWHSRFSTICAFAKNQAQSITLTGFGVLSCTETVYLDRVNFDAPFLRFQAGTHAPNGATNGSPTFFTATMTNTQVTVTPGTPVVVTHTGHGFTDGQEIMFGVANGRVPGALEIIKTYYVKVVDANSYNVAATNGGAALNSATAGFGTIYAFYSASGQSLPAQSSITTQDILLPNGKLKRLGIVVRAATNGTNKDPCTQRFAVWGDGNSDWTTPPSTMNVRFENDDSPTGYYDVVSSCYGFVTSAVQGPLEKGHVSVSGTYGGIGCMVLKGASTDTLAIDLHLSNHLMWWCEHPGVSTSPDVHFECESRDDPDARTNWEGGNGAPSVWIRTGKVTKLSGRMRALNGLNQIVVDGNSNEAGTTVRFGADHLYFDNLSIIDTDGVVLNIKQARNVSGFIDIKETADYDGVNAQASPVAVIGRVSNMGGLHVVIQGCANTEGLNIGGAFADGYLPYGAHLGHWSVSMGSLLQFNPDSNDGTKGTKRTGTSGYPTTLLAAHFEAWDQCYIDLSGTRGKVTLDSGVTGGKVSVDHTMTTVAASGASSGLPGYTVTNNSSAPATTVATL